MRRIALAPLILASAALRWLNGKPDPRAAHRVIVAVVSAVTLLAILSPTPASADHGHNCVWSGGAWVGQGLCPGMPGYTPHTATPTAEPTPTTTQAPEPTTPPVTPEPTSEPTPTTTAPAPTTTAPSPTTAPAPSVTSPALGAVPSTSTTTTPAPVVTGPVVDTDIPYEHRNHPRGW